MAGKVNKWYSITFSGEYLISAESEEKAREIFESESINEAESISIDSIDELGCDTTECDGNCGYCDYTECPDVGVII